MFGVITTREKQELADKQESIKRQELADEQAQIAEFNAIRSKCVDCAYLFSRSVILNPKSKDPTLSNCDNPRWMKKWKGVKTMHNESGWTEKVLNCSEFLEKKGK